MLARQLLGSDAASTCGRRGGAAAAAASWAIADVLRHNCPKGADLSMHSQAQLNKVARQQSGMSPYEPHHDRVQFEGLRPPVRGHSRNSKELGHPSDGAASLYGRHRIAV